MNHRKKLAALLFLACSNFSFAADTGTALKNDSLRSEPYVDAKLAGQLKRGEAVEILSKKGAWLNIKSGKSQGWVRLLSIKRGGINTSNSASDALKVASGRAGTGNVVGTTGVRGLSAEELKSAQFNESEIKILESFTLSKEQAQQFASSANLTPVNFTIIPEAKGTK